MITLGIESSCDETAVAIVQDGRRVLSNSIASSLAKHREFGGVVPEIAAREHTKIIIPLVEASLKEANVDWSDIDAIAYTYGPGLVSSLLIGAVTARTLAQIYDKPLIPTNHIAGHIYSNWLYEKEDEIPDEPQFPVIILTVSGGHNDLVLMKGHHDFEVLGETLDDAAGEAFDKVARILDLGFPGGPVISKIAVDGDSTAFDFPRSMLSKSSENALNFSFSGLKTAVLYAVQDLGTVSDAQKADLAASFQEAVCDTLVSKLFRAVEKYPDIKEIHLAGGVSANLRLREMLEDKIAKDYPDIRFRRPLHMSYCTDNAAMIAAAGHYKYARFEGEACGWVAVEPNLELSAISRKP